MSLIVAGGTKGIGLELARALLPKDNVVVIGFGHDEAAADRAKKSLKEEGRIVRLVKSDLSSPSGAAALIDGAGESTIEHVIHSSLMVGPGSLLDPDPRWAPAWMDALSVNAMSLVWLARSAAARMPKGGTMLYLSSRGGARVFPGYASVGPAKAMGEALVRYLAWELAPAGIRVNALALATQDTASLRAAFGSRSNDLLEGASASPIGRGVIASDYTAAARFLASPDASMITGATLPVYGGGDLSG